MASFDPSLLDQYNEELSSASPQQILTWAIDHLPRLYQTTAFGLTGLAATDMISNISKRRKLPHLVPLIFVDTLYHFDETIQLKEKVENKYKLNVIIYRPPGVKNTEEFEEKYGQRLWETDEDTYDYLVKVSSQLLRFHLLIAYKSPFLSRLNPHGDLTTSWKSSQSLPVEEDHKEPIDRPYNPSKSIQLD